MMTLISLAITVAFGTSLAATFGFFEIELWWELASLITIMMAALLADKRFAQIAGEERLYKASFRKVAEGSDTGIVNIYFRLNVQLIASRGLPLVRAVSHKHFCCNSLDFFVFWPRTCSFKVQTFPGVVPVTPASKIGKIPSLVVTFVRPPERRLKA